MRPPRQGIPAKFGFSDFNDDGHPDEAIGAFNEDVGTLVNAGSVDVLYGSSAGLQDTNPDDQWLTGDIDPNHPAEAGAQFGWAVATGDINADGFADLVIGVPFLDVLYRGNIVADAGGVEVVFGSPSGLTTTNLQSFSEATPGLNSEPPAAGDGFGRTIAVADLNGDGSSDLAIGGRKQSVGTIRDAGNVNVLYGSAGGLTLTGNQLWNENTPGVAADGAEPGDWFGRVVAAGDLNADGYFDLLIGIPFENVGSITDAGAFEVLYGTSAGLQDASPDDQYWTQDSNQVKDTAEAGDLFGHAFVAGDFNGDGYQDVALGVRKEDVGGLSDAGAMNVLYGSFAGLQAVSPGDQFWSEATPGMAADGAEKGDWFGRHVEAGDFNGDGYADVAVAITYEDVGSVTDAGAVEVLYGARRGLQDTEPDDQFWTEASPNLSADGAEAGDWFGRAVAAQDWNGDGYDDLAIGIRREDVGSITDAGAVEVVYGGAFGLQAISPDDQFWTQGSLGLNGDGAEAGDEFGWGINEHGANGG